MYTNRFVVVNHRTELISMYQHLGFIQLEGTKPYPNPANLSRPSHFIEFHRPLELWFLSILYYVVWFVSHVLYVTVIARCKKVNQRWYVFLCLWVLYISWFHLDYTIKSPYSGHYRTANSIDPSPPGWGGPSSSPRAQLQGLWLNVRCTTCRLFVLSQGRWACSNLLSGMPGWMKSRTQWW